MESAALFYWLYKELQSAIERGSSDKINEFLGRALVGTRNDATPLLAHNVLNAIDAVDEDIPGYRQLYQDLCEIAHPNWGGGLGAYAELNTERVWYELEEARLPRPIVLGPLVTTLELFVAFYDRMIPHLQAFAALCERELDPEQ
jgi:hypothetical protein